MSLLYIENGPNYHTYTFNIIKENTEENAPVENLVLTPLPDGTYKGLIFRYNFTEQEKQNILNGIPVDTKGKTTIYEAEGCFNASKVTECNYVEETIWQDCSEHIHNQSNFGDWINCTAEIKPQVYTIGYWSCSSGGGGSESGSGNTGSEDGTGGGNAGNDNCITEVFQNPLDPVAVYNPCPIGVPTVPTLSGSFSLYVNSLPANLKNLLNNYANSDFYDGLSSYFYTNNGSSEAKAFISWAAQFKLDNPTTTWEQFQNWFIDGYSSKYINKIPLLSPEEIQEFVNINKEIDASPYDEENVKEANEIYVAITAQADLSNMNEADIETVLNQCCPNLIVIPQALISEKTKVIALNYKNLRRLYPNWSKGKCLWEASRDTVQLLLDIGGAFPLIGEVCDITNGSIYSMNGDALNAALSYSAAISLAGWGATASKYAVKTVHLVNGAKTTLKFIRRLDGVVTFGNRGQLRKVLGMLKGDLRQAHHIIPWELYDSPAIQKAALSSNAFHLNEALNGIPLNNAVHYGSHANYNNLVKQRLDAIPSNYTPNQVYNEVMDIIQDIRTAINNHPNTPINQLVF
ncbi:AHH domain-containing protein [Chryseobacterium mucoviscidosis]|uniref:AHH domain-containing protein n=2 Tax=Chryseobacterium TaxID=59732 RepID=UPI003018D8A5